MSDLDKIAASNDEKLAKIYIASTIECLLFAATSAGLILYYLGFTAFSVLQSIGSILLMLMIFTAVLKFRKSNIKKNIEKQYQSDSDRIEFENFLRSHYLEYEFLYALIIRVKPEDSKADT
ncbi:MAG: hypothetical protein IKY83_12850 [Proteobacteria bacterium]|nr:hypothetical protein [Pseudomonadota bacterium]